MISYIFKNKTKNILAIAFTALCIFKPLCEFLAYIMHFQAFPVYTVLNLLPYVLLLIYFLTLKYDYKIKSVMFPTAFLIWIAAQIYVAVSDFNSSYSYFSLMGEWPLTTIFILINNAVLLTGKVFCFFGSISNFKNVVLLKAGAIINIIAIAIITPAAEAVSLKEYVGVTNIFLHYASQIVNGEVIFGMIARLLFFISLLLLTLNKKSEDIDITPYAQERKAKKEAKRIARLEAKAQEEARLNAPAPEIPDGSWRCMACGKILPDSENRCECGYKK